MKVIGIGQSHIKGIFELLGQSRHEDRQYWCDFLGVRRVDETAERELSIEVLGGRSKGWVAFKNRRIAGFAIFRRQPTVERSHVLVLALYVDPNERRSSVASDILSCGLHSLADGDEYYRIEVAVREDESFAMEALTQRGFMVEAIRRKSVVDDLGGLVDEFLLAYVPSRH